MRAEAHSLGCRGYFRKVDVGQAIIETIERLAAERQRNAPGSAPNQQVPVEPISAPKGAKGNPYAAKAK